MDKSKYCLFGSFVKVSGVNGGLIIRSSVEIPEKIDEISYIFIEIDGTLVPFRVLEFFERNSISSEVKFMDIDTREDALEYVGKNVFLHKDYMSAVQSFNFPFSGLLGYNIIDEDENELGKIVEVIDIPENPVAKIIIDNKEVLIPVNPEVIIFIDDDKKIIKLNIPRGLLDIYL